MFIKSVRFKIIVWYMLILSVTLLLFSALLYKNFSHKLYGDADNLLQSKAEGIANSIDTYWETEKLEAIKDEVKSSVFSKINNINFIKIAQRWVNERIDDPRLLNIIVQIFDSNGKNIAFSKNISGITTLPKDVFHFVAQGGSRFDTIEIELTPGKMDTLRLYTIPVIEDGKAAYFVQVGATINSIHSALNNLIFILFGLLPLTVFLTGVVGVFLAKMALNPVDKMIDTIHQITVENLKLRINIPNTKDEVRRLADTFNDMLARLETAFSVQRRLIEDLSHELRTPLAILKGELEVTLKKIRTIGEYESVLQSSLEEVNTIVKIVENLLMLVRYEAKEIPLEMKSLDLNVTIRNILQEVKILAERKNIEICFCAQENVRMKADENKLKHLLLNLFDNAFKYTPANGKVSLSLSKDNNFAQIKISDTGVGIPEEELPSIFNRFYRANRSCGRDGFGIGLSIVKSIVEAHKGKITVESKINQGSIFTILLPLS